MTYQGHVKDGRITLDSPVSLPEGARVNVDVIEERPARVLGKVASIAVSTDLPPDYSQQHEHYVKGTPRK